MKEFEANNENDYLPLRDVVFNTLRTSILTGELKPGERLMEKPFHLQELEARIRSLTRRKFVQQDVCLKAGDIRFDTKKREAYVKEQRVHLTRKENGILEYLLLNQGRPVSQEELMEHVWDASVDSLSGAIRVHMSSLRRKLKAVLGYDPILNKVGEGYKIREESDQ